MYKSNFDFDFDYTWPLMASSLKWSKKAKLQFTCSKYVNFISIFLANSIFKESIIALLWKLYFVRMQKHGNLPEDKCSFSKH